MSAPSAMIAICNNCGETLHRVLKGKTSGRREMIFEGVVKCQRCGRVRTIAVREPRPLNVPLILSWMEESQRKEIELERQATISLGEIMDFEGGKIEITAIESEAKRVSSSEAARVTALWAKKVDKVRIKITIAKGNRLRSKEIFVEPEKEFQVEDELWLDTERNIIEKIKVQQRTMYRGSALASDIKRIYTRVPSGARRSSRFAPKKISSRRGANDDGRKSRQRQ